MLRKYVIGLVAVGMLVIFMTETADAAYRRIIRSVVTEHTCPDTDPECGKAIKVHDQIYGAYNDGTVDEPNWVASCILKGLVFCNGVVDQGCAGSNVDIPLSNTEFEATVPVEDGSALTRAFLASAVGDGFCDDGYTFRTFWPYPKWMARTIYTFVEGEGAPIDELCTTPDSPNEITGEFEADCVPFTGKIPCCGDPTKLTVTVTGPGKVTSVDDENINCEGGCDYYYGEDDPDDPVLDTCPLITLSATPTDSAYVFTRWDVEGDPDACSGIGDCTVTPNANVTATFGLNAGYIKVTIIGGSADDAKVWIKSPQKADFYEQPPPSDYCYDECIINTLDAPFTDDNIDSIILKRAGGDWDTWTDSREGENTCETGDNNSNTTCVIGLPLPSGPGAIGIEITAVWAP